MTVTPRQLPLALEPETGYSIDDLVVTEANRTAFELLERWPHWPSPVVVLVGDEGAGKSHLAAVWAAQSFAKTFSCSRINAAVNAATLGTPILIEDVAGGSFDETALFHLINTVRQASIDYPQASLLMTTTKRPVNWQVALPDLASRLKAVALIEITPPDDVLMTAVITKLFADRQLAVEPNIIRYVVSRIERSTATASRFVALVDHMALEQKSKISRQLAADVLRKMASDNDIEEH